MSVHKPSAFGIDGREAGQVAKERSGRHRSEARRIRVGQLGTPDPGMEAACAGALDAAAFLALVPRPMSWLKMQDLLYYAQGWHLVWDGEPLIADPIEATPSGVRIGPIDALLSGDFAVKRARVAGGDPRRLGESARQTLSGIVKFYGHRNHFRLSQAIMGELPWLKAREASGADAAHPVICIRELRQYFAGL